MSLAHMDVDCKIEGNIHLREEFWTGCKVWVGYKRNGRACAS